jgi:hypothetical protein
MVVQFEYWNENFLTLYVENVQVLLAATTKNEIIFLLQRTRRKNKLKNKRE